MPISPTDPPLNYVRHGSGPDLVLIHGVGSNLTDWDGVAARLADSFTLLRYDLRGHGGSGAPAGPYEIVDFAGDFISLMDHLGIQAPNIAGFSLGGLIAQSIALDNPERVNKLALLSTVAGRTEEERERVMQRLNFIARSHPTDYFDQSVQRWFTDAFRAANPDAVAGRKAAVAAMDQTAYAAAYHALATTDFGPRLVAIAAPTLVATGEHDMGSNTRMARFMANQIVDSRLEVLPGLKHSILIEAPEAVADMLMAFFLEN